jgi:hypothetical protein
MTIPRRAAAVFFCILILLAPAAGAAEDSFAVTIAKAAGGSAAGKGAEFAVKLLGGLIFKGACKDKVLQPGDQYLCDALGGVTGDAENEWKQKVEKQLSEINTKLGTLEKGQKAIQSELRQQHAVMLANFNQASARVEATHAIVRIENLWEKYLAQFDRVDDDLRRESMLAFAHDIIDNKLHTKLGDLNIVLTKSTLDGQPLLAYPFHEWRLKRGTGAPAEAFDAKEIYDFAEKKFVDFRIQQHKVYVMYFWAAAVLESECTLHPAQCSRPPRSTADFNADYERYTRQQLVAFNTAVDGLLLSATLVHNDRPRTLPGVGNSAEEVLLRANFLTANTLTSGEGLWGRVISMGNAWDGSLDVECRGRSQTVLPVMSYAVPVEDRSGSLDWWVSRNHTLVYDEVHFASEWKVNHYQLPAAGAGPCKIKTVLPKNAGMLPWSQNGTEVVEVQTADGRRFPFGSFLAIQRAGGTYALASGAWKRRNEPLRTEDGKKGQRENGRWDWTITTDRRGAPWTSLLSEGDGEWRIATGTSRIYNRHQIYLYNEKRIFFPEGGTLRLNLLQHNDCAKVCRGTDASDFVVMSYDVMNNDTDAKRGRMTAVAAIYLHPTVGNPDQFNDQLGERAKGNGIVIDGSYGLTGDQKTKNVSGDQSATFTAVRGTGYFLQYLLDFEVETEGRFTNKTRWMYRGKLTPSWLYVTR